ncbi:MAG: MBL fold metallo-hydrolase [Chloroflexi bacterium]|nr:MBL fold metallo-hydrolase [Chloroflexota bacterium]
MQTIMLDAVDAVTITTVIDNVIDVFMPDQGPATRFREGTVSRTRRARTLAAGLVDEIPTAEHGFAALVTVVAGEQRQTILFDAGRTPDGLRHNLRTLRLDHRDITAIVLSHGHFDHTTGLDGLARLVGRANLPVLIHPEFWNRRRLVLPGREPWELPTTSRSALIDVGFDILEGRQPSFLLDRCLLVTGEIDRTSDFEPGFPFQEAWQQDRWQSDPLVLDDQAIIINVRDRGLVVMTGCGHAGIINTLRYAQRLTGVDRIHAVIGGFHLNGPFYEALIPATCDALEALAPDVLVPSHCTGWRATHQLAARFPKAFVPSSVGTRIELRAPESEVTIA